MKKTQDKERKDLQESREISMISLEYWSVIRGYEEAKWNQGTNEVTKGNAVMEYIVSESFYRFNTAWVDYCKGFMEREDRVCEPNMAAFMEYCSGKKAKPVL